ncbi:hypothetical protein CBOM_04424 [Ceraceosorus bombacis]|uniref:Uncharacterized protein n=1 Tax=Ceraceosorus bombacis TaxID=401625 RepID=A0A0P1BQH9_9BASI|nr:hypothetical protein CBOM_04424 [Ceraceosorus bombacis]
MTEALKRRISAAKQRMSAKLLQPHDHSASNCNANSSAALASDLSRKARIGSDKARGSSGPEEAPPSTFTFTLPTSTSIAHLSALLLLLRNLESSVRKASSELKRIADAERARARDAAEKNDAKHGDCDLPAYGHTFSDSPDELDLPPAPSHSQASQSKAQSTSDKSKLYLAEEDDDKAWASYIARSSYRFQLWQERIASRTSSDAEAQLLPPLDVFIVWAALITEQDAQTIPDHSLLQCRHFPLQYVTAYDTASLSIKSSSALREAEHMIDASESVKLWQALTSTPFVAPLLEHESLRSTTSDPLTTKGVPLICPSPLCDSHLHTRADQTSQAAAAIKHISFLRRRAHAIPTLRASENKRRGLAEIGWSRTCPCCQTKICMDTIAGAQLVADLQRWCEDGDFVLSGLAHHVETGMPLPLWHAHAIAASILTPLLSAECLSTSRRSTNLTCLTLASQRLEAQDCDLELDLAFLLPPSGNISSVASNGAASAASLGTSGNSLSAALRAAAAASFSSTPEEMGLTHEYSLSKMQTWLVQHGIKAHPSVIQVAERGWDTTWPSTESSLRRNASHSRRIKRVGMTIGHENSMADKMGGGSSAGGLNFNFDSIAEDANTRMTSQAAQQVSQSIGNVISQRLLKPYRDQCNIGLPPMRPGAATVISAVEAVKGMSGFSKALESWASAHVLAYSASQSDPPFTPRSSEKDADGGGGPACAPCSTTLQKSFVKQALHEYACTMQDLQKRCSNDYKALGALGGAASKFSLLGRRRAGVQEVLLDREELCELLLEAGPGVRLAWITHMLSTDYTTLVHSTLRSLPLHSWSAISAPTHLSSV